MNDPTKNMRRVMQPVVNALPDEAITGITYTTDQLRAEFTVVGFLAPFVEVVRKSDGVRGTMPFRHDPRVYFDFTPEGGAR